MADKGRKTGTSTAAKAALAILGVSLSQEPRWLSEWTES